MENTTPPYLDLSVCHGVDRSELLTLDTGRWGEFVILISSIPWLVVPKGNNCLRESKSSLVSGEECVEEANEGLDPFIVSKMWPFLSTKPWLLKGAKLDIDGLNLRWESEDAALRARSTSRLICAWWAHTETVGKWLGSRRGADLNCLWK